MALVGEELEEGDEICGAVVSLRSKVDRIQVWTRGKDDVEKLNGIGKRLVKLLDVSEADNIGLEFQVCFLLPLSLFFFCLRIFSIRILSSSTAKIDPLRTDSSLSNPYRLLPSAPRFKVTHRVPKALRVDMPPHVLSGAPNRLLRPRLLPLVGSARGWVLVARCGRLLVRSERNNVQE